MVTLVFSFFAGQSIKVRQFGIILGLLVLIIWGIAHLLFDASSSDSAADLTKVVRGFSVDPNANVKAYASNPESVAKAFSQGLESVAQQRPSASYDAQLRAIGRDQDDLGRALSDYLKVQLDPESPEATAIRSSSRAEEVRHYLEARPDETTQLVFQVLDQVAIEDSESRSKLLNYYRNLTFQEGASGQVQQIVSQWGKAQDWQDNRRRIELTQVVDILRLQDPSVAQQTLIQIRDRYHGNREMSDFLNSQYGDLLGPDPN